MAKTISDFRKSGIECRILTGDSKETATSVGIVLNNEARAVGISDGYLLSMSGKEFKNLENSKIYENLARVFFIINRLIYFTEWILWIKLML